MDCFSLRNECNALLSHLNGVTGRRNIIKLGLDIRLQEKFSGDVQTLIEQITMLVMFLDDILVNGIIHIEISNHAKVDTAVTMLVTVMGRGKYAWDNEKNDCLKAKIAKVKYRTHYSIKDDEVQFELYYSASAIGLNEDDPKLPFYKKKVLLAEDNEINAMVFSTFLEEWGCENTMAVNGEQAVSIAHDGEFDAILMDIFMPVLNGNQATRKIREFNAKVPIIALTASTRDEDIREAVSSGANDYLLKPVSSANLFHVLAKYF